MTLVVENLHRDGKTKDNNDFHGIDELKCSLFLFYICRKKVLKVQSLLSELETNHGGLKIKIVNLPKFNYRKIVL